MASTERELLERIAEATELLVKLALKDVQGDRSQLDMILMLSTMGYPPGRIADYLGTTTKTVYPALSRARKSGRQPRG